MKREKYRIDNMYIILEIDILDFVNHDTITNNKRKVF